MSMQDNELDELFRSKLSGLEMELPAHVWENIANEIGSKKRTLAPLLRIAATILVVLATGTWFLLDKPSKVKVEQVATNKIPVPDHVPVKSTEPEVIQSTEQAISGSSPSVIEQPAHQLAAHKATHQQKQTLTSVAEQPHTVIEPPIQQVTQPVLAAVEHRPILQPVVPDGQIAIRNIDTTPATIKPLATAPVIMAANKPAQEQKKRHGIHSLGDLVNVVVAKVDKREDKLIEFTETDEGSNITGLNLGIIRVKKENK